MRFQVSRWASPPRCSRTHSCCCSTSPPPDWSLIEPSDYVNINVQTSRGCPFTCAFCEWGTGAIGSRMHQWSLERIRRDWETIVAAGIKDIINGPIAYTPDGSPLIGPAWHLKNFWMSEALPGIFRPRSFSSMR